MKLMLVLVSSCCLWCPTVAAHLNATATPATPGVPPALPPCNTNSDCEKKKTPDTSSVVICDTTTRHCICDNRTLVLTGTWHCLPIRMLGQPCRQDEQCYEVDSHALCEDHYCKCDDGYYIFNDINGSSCTRDEELQTMRPFGWDKKRESISDENMVPIIVCLAIMFVGMCVALQLFSRARFRNQRSIFNSPNPRLMRLKLGKGDSKRRHSHASLQGGSRRPSTTSQQFSPRFSRPGIASAQRTTKMPVAKSLPGSF